MWLGIQFMVWYDISGIPGSLRICELLLLQRTGPGKFALFIIYFRRECLDTYSASKCSATQELYTGSNDRQILVWSPSTPAFTEMVYHLALSFLLGLPGKLYSHGFE
jgi:hypothetical protein